MAIKRGGTRARGLGSARVFLFLAIVKHYRISYYYSPRPIQWNEISGCALFPIDEGAAGLVEAPRNVYRKNLIRSIKG